MPRIFRGIASNVAREREDEMVNLHTSGMMVGAHIVMFLHRGKVTVDRPQNCSNSANRS